MTLENNNKNITIGIETIPLEDDAMNVSRSIIETLEKITQKFNEMKVDMFRRAHGDIFFYITNNISQEKLLEDSNINDMLNTVCFIKIVGAVNNCLDSFMDDIFTNDRSYFKEFLKQFCLDENNAETLDVNLLENYLKEKLGKRLEELGIKD